MPPNGQTRHHSKRIPTSTPEQRLVGLGIELPPVMPPAGNSLGCVRHLLYIGGRGPVNGDQIIQYADFALTQPRP